MRRWWRSHSVRVRLTLWYVAAMVVVLAVYAAVVFAFVSRSISATLNTRLLGDFQWASAMVEQTPEGGITWSEDITDEEFWLRVWSADGELLYQNSEARTQPSAREPRHRAARRREHHPTSTIRWRRFACSRVAARLAAARSSSRSAGPRPPCDRSSTSSRSFSRSGCRWRGPLPASAATHSRGVRCCPLSG